MHGPWIPLWLGSEVPFESGHVDKAGNENYSTSQTLAYAY